MAPLLRETAIQLERVLEMAARFWTNAEANYRQFLVRQEEVRRLAEQRKFLKELPTAQLGQGGMASQAGELRIPFAEHVAVLRRHLSRCAVPNRKRTKCLAFRQSAVHHVDHYALLAWLRIGELEAQKTQCASYGPKSFRRALRSIRGLCNNSVPKAVPQMGRACAESGVALVFVPEISACRAWGVTQWVSPEKAILQLSLRGKTDDQFLVHLLS